MSFIKKLNKKWADSSPLEKTIKIILLLFVLGWIGFDMWDDIIQDKVLEFYGSTPSTIIIPLAIALVAGIMIYFFAIYLSPPQRRIAGLIWWGIGNTCLLGIAGIVGWLTSEFLRGLQSPYYPVVEIAKTHIFPALLLFTGLILGAIVSWYSLIRKYKKNKKHCIPTKDISAENDA